MNGRDGFQDHLVVLDMLGRKYYSKIVVLDESGHTLAFDPHGRLSAGMYLIVGSSSNKLYSKKLIIR